jgi:hypothetical protein
VSTIKVNTIQTAAGTGSLTVPAETGTVVTTASPSLGRRNLIINGAMQVAQRGTSFTGIDGYGLDRHITDVFGGSTAVFNAEQSSDAPDGFSHSYKVTVSTSETPSGSDATSIFQHRIEGQNIQHLGWGDTNVKHVTLSFWVKSSVTGDFPFGLEVFCTNSADDTGFMQAYTINSANTWEFKTITIPLWDSSVSVVTPRGGNDFGIILRFGGGGVSTRQGVAGWQSRSTSLTGMSGAISFTSNASATWQITGVQLEVGSVATPFEHRSYGEELALCQRYYYFFGQGTGGNSGDIGIGSYYNSTYLDTVIQFPVTMRVTPTLVATSGTDYYASFRNNGADYFNTLILSKGCPSAAAIGSSDGVSGTGGYATIVRFNSASASIAFDSEL